jgi:PKD repeat protein
MIAHSAGVMVTRAYVQLTKDTIYTPVNKLLLAGGTNKGILANYAAREGLYGDNPVFQFMLGPVLWVKSYECGNYTFYPNLLTYIVTDEDRYMTLHERRCGILSAPEQLPAPGPTDPVYLVESNNNPYPYPVSPGSPNGYQYNPLLQAEPTDLAIYPQKDPWYLPDNSNPGTTYYNLNGTILADLAHRNIPVQNVHIFYSDSLDTDYTYEVTDPSSLSPLRRNGVLSTEVPYKDKGDGSVASYSARAPDLWPGVIEHRLVWLESGTDDRPENHTNLLVYPESQQEIGLTLSGIELPFSTPMNTLNGLIQSQSTPRVLNGFGLSPVELLVIDSLGRRLGYDPGSGQILQEIPLGFYAHPTGEPVEFAIYEPVAGDYTITVTGTGSGPYTLLDVFTDEHSSVPILFEENTIQMGGTYTTTMTVPTSSGDVPYPPDVNAGIDLSTTVGTPVEFEATIKDINPNDTFDIQWDFGDGSSASATLTPSHIYTVPDTYLVTLTVVDSTGFNVSDTLTVTVNETATVVSIVRASENPTNAESVDFTVTFSEAVTGVDANDFTLALDGVTGASITDVSGTGDTYTVTVNTGAGNGTIGLDVVAGASIEDLAGNPLEGGFTGAVYTVDKSAEVEVHIGGDLKGSYPIEPGENVSPQYAGLSDGPVLVESTNGQEIIVSERQIYGSSFTETLGVPDNQLTTKYWFPWYDGTTMSTWISISVP